LKQQLLAFARSGIIKAGDSQKITLNVTALELSIVDYKSGDRVLSPGEYDIVLSAGNAADDVSIKLTINGDQKVMEAFPAGDFPSFPKRRLSLKTTDWRMLDATTPYPNHYVTRKMSAAESASMVIDGKLDEPAWQNAQFTYDMVDITRHKNQQLNAIPNDLQMRVKIRWDDNYFYVGAILHESYVTAQNVGHNNHAPYSPDNDFEIFIDPSGTTQVRGCLTAACFSHNSRQTDGH